MKFAVVDDEPAILEQLPALLRQYAREAEIACFQNPTDFLASLSESTYDALFLDIDMPDITGFALAGEIRKNHDEVPIVYITGRDDLMIQAFRYKPIGFVRKQYLESELSFAMSAVFEELQRKTPTIQIIEARSKENKTHVVKISEITYLEHNKHYIEIHLQGGTVMTTREKLSAFTEHPDFKDFVLINAGTFVNLAFVTVIDETVVFEDQTTLFISRRRIPFVLKAYLSYVKKVLI